MRLPAPLTLWCLGFALLASLGVWFGGPLEILADMMVADVRISEGELHRLLTGALVHSDYGQAGRDLSMFLLIGWVYERQLGRRYMWLLLVCLVTPTAVAMATHFELGVYFGLSGAVNGLFVAAMIFEWGQASRRGRWIVAALMTVHLGKLLFETLSGGMLMPMELASGVTPLHEAHLSGALVGALFMLTTRTPRSSSPAPEARCSA